MSRFKQIISEIPEDRRAVLYNRMKAMPEGERNKLICEFVSRYDAAKSVPTRVNSPEKVDPTRTVTQTKDVPMPAPKRTDGKLHSKKKLKKSVRKAISLTIIGLVLIGSIILLLINLDNIKGLFGSTEETNQTTLAETVSETSSIVETTIPEETATPTPSPSPTPAPTMVPVREDAPDLSGLIVVIDPGHQQFDNDETEICSVSLGNEKAKCTSGAVGVVSGIGEYDLTLQYAIVVREYLQQCGATVILTRETNDADVSNQERAAIANQNNANLFIRLHADAANDSATSGVRVYVPSSGSMVSENTSNANVLGTLIAAEEGFEFDSSCVRATNQYTGLNYADSLHSFQVSLGFLSNSDDESILLDEDNMVNVAAAIAEFATVYAYY